MNSNKIPIINATNAGWKDTRGSKYLPVAIGVSLLDGKFMHDNNPGGWPSKAFWTGVDKDRWYKVDIAIDWDMVPRAGICPNSACRVYSIRLNDVELVFDQKFIDLARAVYQTNDKRSEIKLEINEFFGSTLVEVKSYEKY